MKAFAFKTHGGPEQLQLIEIDRPTANKDEVLIKVHARGINRAEIYMRNGEWGEVPNISGIECVGEIITDPTGVWETGQKVAAVMGGMGRSRSGSYAEYVTINKSNVFAINTSLEWQDFAAIPETYATAWAAVMGNLDLKPDQVILVHGGTSALGQAAINIAKDEGATVIATTRSDSRQSLLERLHVDHILIDDDDLKDKVQAIYPNGIDHVLELIGTGSLLSMANTIKLGGKICLAGVLGGNAPLENFNPLFDLPVGIHLSAFGSYVFGTDNYPLSKIPMQKIIEKVASGQYKAIPDHVFPFSQLPDAHRLMDSYSAQGKVVVTM